MHDLVFQEANPHYLLYTTLAGIPVAPIAAKPVVALIVLDFHLLAKGEKVISGVLRAEDLGLAEPAALLLFLDLEHQVGAAVKQVPGTK